MGTLASTWKDIWTVWNIWEFSPEHMRFWSRHQGLESLLLESLHSPSHCFGTRLHPLSLLPSSFWNLLRKVVHPVHPVHNPKLHVKIGTPLLLRNLSQQIWGSCFRLVKGEIPWLCWQVIQNRKTWWLKRALNWKPFYSKYVEILVHVNGVWMTSDPLWCQNV